MSDQKIIESEQSTTPDVRDVVRQAIQEFITAEQRKAEPAYKTELQEERKRRESLEARVNHLIEENRKARAMAEEADRNAQIRNELQKMGITKIDLAFKAIKDDITRTEDGHLQAKGPDGKSLQEYVTQFVQENPELLPARMSGGSGVLPSSRSTSQTEAPGFQLEQIKPGMNKEELDRVRQHISRLASQALRGA
jgi:hypothetical protein